MKVTEVQINLIWRRANALFVLGWFLLLVTPVASVCAWIFSFLFSRLAVAAERMYRSQA